MQLSKIYQVFMLLFFILISFAVLGETTDEWYNKGYNANTVEKAIEFYSNAISVDPNYKYAYMKRGFLKMTQGDLDGAIEDFNKAIEISPRLANAYEIRGKAKKAKGDLEGAQRDFLRAEQERKKGDFLLEELNARILAEPYNAKLYWGRAEYKKLENDYVGAISDYDKYIELIGKPNNTLPYWYRAHAKETIGDMEGALADYTLIIEQFPTESAYLDRAKLKRKLGDIEGAQTDELEVQKIRRQEILENIQKLSQDLAVYPTN